MKAAYARNLVFVLVAIISAIAISVGLGSKTGAVTACGDGTTTCPYVKTFGADVFAGGWFSPNCSSNYQNYQYGTPPNTDYGGILTYAKESGTTPSGGSSSQYGAFALGSIEGNDGAYQGFYSSGATDSNRNLLSFANSGLPNGGNAWGGQLEGGSIQGHCIPDYYTSKQTNPTAYPAGISIDNLGSGNYTVDASAGTFALDLGSGTIGPGRNVDIFVKGNVYISGGNITYAAHGPTNVPKFALVVQGDIYIDPSVTTLTGWYIAEPTASATLTSGGGVIWDCNNSDQTKSLDASWLVPNCKNKLTINGALVAKHVNLFRTNGDVVANGNTGEDSLAGANDSGNISEVINYTPDMVIGGPFFNSGSSYNLDSLVSLPPILR